MSLASLLVHDVGIVRSSTTTDRTGNTTKTYAAAVTVDGWITQRSSSEDTSGREAQVSQWVLYLAAGTDVEGIDRVTWEGQTFEVDGAPLKAWTPRGEHHIEVPLRVAVG